LFRYAQEEKNQMTDGDILRQEFHQAMIRVYEKALQQCHYNAHIFRGMVEEHGGLETARRLLHSPATQYGFEKLWECGCLNITMEYQVIQERWATLFTPEEIQIARKRLTDYGLELPKR
jgi:hypothetical protein